MNKPLTAALIGAALLAPAVSATEGLADEGRYRLIPKVMIPSDRGKSLEQAVLLDTETGRTWRLAWDAKQGDAKQGKTEGARWVPMEVAFPEDFDSDRAAIASRPGARGGAFGSEASSQAPSDRRFDEHYDDDP